MSGLRLLVAPGAMPLYYLYADSLLRYSSHQGLFFGDSGQSGGLIFPNISDYLISGIFFYEHQGLRVVDLRVLVVGEEGATKFVAVCEEIMPRQMHVHCSLSFSREG